jgi:3-hydroxyacyl-CoA dehydrogenase
MKRIIRKVAVLGSGIMGSRIAAHFANIGVKVLLLDIVPKELTGEEKAKGLDLSSPQVRNRIVNSALKTALDSKPSPIYEKKVISLIKTGNFEDDLPKIAEVDWIMEAVIENIDIKKSVFDRVEKYRKPGTLVSTNTSGIPIHLMAEGRSDDFQRHFLGTHFFNPPRYLKLLEIIPTQKTDPEITRFLMRYGDLYLGKTTVECNDTPAFIGNRIGIWSMLRVMQLMQEHGLTIDEVDRLTGPIIGRPKSATFRTSDLVGLDTFVHVAKNLYDTLKDDPAHELFKVPAFVEDMFARKWLGDKTGQGFYKKVKKGGESEILTLDLKSMEYGPKQKVKLATLDLLKTMDNLNDRMVALVKSKDKVGEFFRGFFDNLFEYASGRIPEIAGELYKIDLAMKAGFGWEQGPFETWDVLGVRRTVERMKTKGLHVPPWVEVMLGLGHETFYMLDHGIKHYYDIPTQSYKPIPGLSEFIILDNIRSETSVVAHNPGASVIDIGDGVLCVEFHSKMNTIGGDTLAMLSNAIDIAESQGWNGVVVGNQGANFSAGANLALMLMAGVEQEFDEIDLLIRQFQKTVMRLRYSAIPVVVAPHGLALGGGCEMTLHGDAVQAAAETYIGLVEFGVGLIPAGCGSKEMAMRAADAVREGDIELNALKNAFLMIANAKVSTSADEARAAGILRQGDRISINKDRQLLDAKTLVLEMAKSGYRQPVQRNDIHVLGREGLGMIYTGANAMRVAGYISQYDEHICQKLGYVMCGGDLSATTEVSEQYLLDLEREAFLSLLGERKTLERIEAMLKTGKALRN